MRPIDFIEDHTQRNLLLYLHHHLINLGLRDSMRYKLPFYDGKKWICYLRPVKGLVELSFIHGNQLSNSQGLLVQRDRKQVRSLLFTSPASIPEDALLEIIHEAILLDELS